MYNWITLLCTWNWHSIVSQLYSNNVKKKKEENQECFNKKYIFREKKLKKN